MTQQDDFLGGLHFDGHREVRVGPQTGIVRYYPVGPADPPARPSPWWHALGVVVGLLGTAAAVFAGGWGVERLADARPLGLVVLGLAGLLVAALTLGRLSPAAPLAGGLLVLTAAVVREVGSLPLLPVLRPVFDSGVPVGLGVALVVLALRRR
ncbi:hypothetical protein [Saccharothrix obliqua]|uniref:hypothetical protein n=1 Tax=Saccharothrix obliqua TaxID=2861747 RepID=UPI001C5FD0B7|nr:hypothetical protein [Saccharothrix obliqua]MBW4715555.1 hypothetical protein [Saccharothrix obliqua]